MERRCASHRNPQTLQKRFSQRETETKTQETDTETKTEEGRREGERKRGGTEIKHKVEEWTH